MAVWNAVTTWSIASRIWDPCRISSAPRCGVDLDEYTSAIRSAVLLGSFAITMVSVFFAGRYWAKNSILKQEIALLNREIGRLEDALMVERNSPDSVRLISQLTDQNERLDAMVKARDVRVREQDRYIEELHTEWNRREAWLKTQYNMVGIERPKAPAERRADFADQMNSHLGLEEVKTLCFALDVDYEGLGSEADGKRAKIEKLIIYTYRRGMLDKLRELVVGMVPGIRWVTV
jgi:hypothetical protein